MTLMNRIVSLYMSNKVHDAMYAIIVVSEYVLVTITKFGRILLSFILCNIFFSIFAELIYQRCKILYK